MPQTTHVPNQTHHFSPISHCHHQCFLLMGSQSLLVKQLACSQVSQKPPLSPPGVPVHLLNTQPISRSTSQTFCKVIPSSLATSLTCMPTKPSCSSNQPPHGQGGLSEMLSCLKYYPHLLLPSPNYTLVILYSLGCLFPPFILLYVLSTHSL